MNTLEAFLTYAAEFEKTLVDDDWKRLEPFFSEDAVYRVESNFFGCELEGPSAIFAGMKKSLDGFDRHFPSRKIDLTEGPTVDGDELRATWEITYTKEGQPDFHLRGKSMARLVNGKIELLVDSYDDAVKEETAKWMKETGVLLDASYV